MTTPATPYPKGRLRILAVGAFAIGTDTFVVAGVLPEVGAALHVSSADAGWVSAVFALVYAVAAPVFGALTASVERRQLMFFALCAFGLGNALSAVAPTLGLLIAARVFTAASAALYIPAASAMASLLVPAESRGRALATVLGGISLATVVGVPIGTWVAAAAGWRLTFWIVAALGVACALALRVALPELRMPGAPGIAARFAPMRDIRVLLTVLTTILFMTGGYTALTYIGAVFGPATHGDGTMLALLLLVFGVAAVAGTRLAGAATDRYGATGVLLGSTALLALALVSLPITADRLWTAMVCIALWGFAGMATQPPQQHRLIGLMPEARPLVLSLNSAATFVGIAAGGAIGSGVLRYAEPGTLGVVGAALVAVSVVTASLAARSAKVAARQDPGPQREAPVR